MLQHQVHRMQVHGKNYTENCQNNWIGRALSHRFLLHNDTPNRPYQLFANNLHSFHMLEKFYYLRPATHLTSFHREQPI